LQELLQEVFSASAKLQEQLLKAKVVFVNLQYQQKKTDVDLEILQRLLLNLKVVSDDRRNEQNDFKVLIYARRL